MTTSTPYAPQIKIPELLERGKSQISTLPVYRDGILQAPTSVKYSLISPSGVKLVDNATGTYPGNIPTYTHGSSILNASLALGEGYLQEWEISFVTGVYTFRRNAALVLRRLYPVISDMDLTATYSQLADLRPSSMSSYQTYIDEAWYTMIQRMRQEGNIEYLIMSSESFRAAHQNLCLYYIFRDFHSSLGQSNGRYLDLANEHHKQYQSEWKIINFIYDHNHDNHGTTDRVAKSPVIYLTNPPTAYRLRRK